MPSFSGLLDVRLRHLPSLAQDAIVGASTFVFGVLLYLTGLYPLSLFGVEQAGPVGAHLLTFGGLCCLELLRRSAPAVALTASVIPLGADVALGLSVPPILVLGDLLYAGSLYGSPRVSRAMIPLVAVATLTAVGAALVLTPYWRSGVIAAVAAIAFLIVPVWWATNVRQYADIATAERTNAAALARIAELDRSAAVASERGRMARDLHDVISGHLSAIAIHSEAALSISTDDTTTQALRTIRANGTQGLHEMRTMIALLRTDASGQESFAAPTGLAQLPSLVDATRANGVDVELYDHTTDELPTAVDLAAYRIAQEALTNVIKHSPTRKVAVSVRHNREILTIEIVNSLGQRQQSCGHDGMGLLNMRERATALGGSVSAGPEQHTWCVRAVLPTPGGSS